MCDTDKVRHYRSDPEVVEWRAIVYICYTERPSLSWMQYIFTSDFGVAHFETKMLGNIHFVIVFAITLTTWSSAYLSTWLISSQ
jgi:hypothetical protein